MVGVESTDDFDAKSECTSTKKSDVAFKSKIDLGTIILHKEDSMTIMNSGICKTRDECQKVFLVEKKMLTIIDGRIERLISNKKVQLMEVSELLHFRTKALKKEVNLLLNTHAYNGTCPQDDELKKLLKTENIIPIDELKNMFLDCTNQYNDLIKLSTFCEMRLVQVNTLLNDNTSVVDDLNSRMIRLFEIVFELTDQLRLRDQETKDNEDKLVNWGLSLKVAISSLQ